MQKRIPNNAGVDLKIETEPVRITIKKEVKDGQRKGLHSGRPAVPG
jgi:hypothetical protein